MVETCVEVAARLQAQGIGVTVVEPRWVKPLPVELVDLAGSHRLVVSVEDNGRVGGCGSVLAQAILDARLSVPVRMFGIPQRFLDHGKRAALLEDIGLDPQSLAREITAHVSALDGSEAPSTPSSTADSA
jgi:1-deoxy-D-xylulose-5-phosphate synthase